MRDTLKYFEQIHSFFAQAMPSVNTKALPARIVAFHSRPGIDGLARAIYFEN